MITFKIEEKIIGEGQPVFLIAEAGVNHNGDLEIAKKMIDVAADAKADAVKFQTFRTEGVMIRKTPKVAYQIDPNKPEENFFEMAKRLEFSFEQFRILKEYCQKRRIIFLSTPFDFDAIDWLDSLGVSAYKVSSGDFVNYPFLKHIMSKGKPMIVSSGMASFDEVKETIKFFKKNSFNHFALLQCTSSYPTPFEHVNLKVLEKYKMEFPQIVIGFSDHSSGTVLGPVAVGMGAKIIEKHFTLDKSSPGPDHKASLDPNELIEYISNIRNTEIALGSPDKKLTSVERDVKEIARKSIVSNKKIKQGKRITQADITFKRPGNGIPPKDIEKVIGKVAKGDIEEDTIIKWEDLED